MFFGFKSALMWLNSKFKCSSKVHMGWSRGKTRPLGGTDQVSLHENVIINEEKGSYKINYLFEVYTKKQLFLSFRMKQWLSDKAMDFLWLQAFNFNFKLLKLYMYKLVENLSYVFSLWQLSPLPLHKMLQLTRKEEKVSEEVCS